MTTEAVLVVAVSLVLTSCIIEVSPDVPSNAAIEFVGAVQMQDTDTAGRLMCSSASEAEPDFLNVESFGKLQPFVEAKLQADSKELNTFGGAAEFSATEQADLAVDHAWTEIDFVDGDLVVETWRLQMARESGSWKVCDAGLS